MHLSAVPLAATLPWVLTLLHVPRLSPHAQEHTAGGIPAENITCLTRLDHNRAISQVRWALWEHLILAAGCLHCCAPFRGCDCILTVCTNRKGHRSALSALNYNMHGVPARACARRWQSAPGRTTPT